LIGAFAPGLRLLAPVLRDVTQFVWRVTRRQADLCEVSDGLGAARCRSDRQADPY
jgi:hypothetical protein